MRNILCATICLLFCCSVFGRQQNIPVYNIIQHQQDTAQMRLSEIADSIYYLTLRTPYGVRLSSDLDIRIGKEYILVADLVTQDLYLFDKHGKYLTLIGEQHKEVEPLSVPFACLLDEKAGEVLAFDDNHYTFYNLKGIPLRGFRFKWPAERAYLRNDRLTLFRNMGDGLKIHITHPSGKWLSEKWLGSDMINGNLHTDGNNTFRTWQLGDSLVAWNKTSDTIYNIGLKAEPNPRFVIDARSIKSTESNTGNASSYIAIKDSMIVDAVLESRDYIFADAMYKMQRRFMVCKKDHSKIFNLVYNLDVMDHGFYNDLDGGPPFLPEKQMDENVFFSILKTERFLKAYNDPYTKSIEPKNKAMQQTLKRFVESLVLTDELIIQVAIFKH